ncbi:MAG: DUF6174 domain-containing protein [Bacteroidota bacterium]|jgi:hypothetical protein
MRRTIFHLLCFAVLIFLSACKDAGTDVKYLTGQIVENYSNINNPSARWQAYGLKNYVLEQRRDCFCPPDGACQVYVRENAIVDVVRESDGKSIFAEAPQRYKTVDELFTLANSFNSDSVASLMIQYDARFGYPTLISVDISLQIADEELSYRTFSIKQILK